MMTRAELAFKELINLLSKSGYGNTEITNKLHNIQKVISEEVHKLNEHQYKLDISDKLKQLIEAEPSIKPSFPELDVNSPYLELYEALEKYACSILNGRSVLDQKNNQKLLDLAYGFLYGSLKRHINGVHKLLGSENFFIEKAMKQLDSDLAKNAQFKHKDAFYVLMGALIDISSPLIRKSENNLLMSQSKPSNTNNMFFSSGKGEQFLQGPYANIFNNKLFDISGPLKKSYQEAYGHYKKQEESDKVGQKLVKSAYS